MHLEGTRKAWRIPEAHDRDDGGRASHRGYGVRTDRCDAVHPGQGRGSEAMTEEQRTAQTHYIEAHSHYVRVVSNGDPSPAQEKDAEDRLAVAKEEYYRAFP